MLVGKNIIGIQFHPEKSGPSGLQVLKNIIELKYFNSLTLNFLIGITCSCIMTTSYSLPSSKILL